MRSLELRKDCRNLEVFKSNIQDFTEREYHWGIALRFDFSQRGAECSVEEHGVDNNGNLILDRLPNYNVDKIFHFKNSKNLHIEIKTIPENVRNFFTFKVSSLRSCLKENAKIIVPRSSCYYLLKSNTIKEILLNYDHKIYPKFSSNDLAIRIYINDINEMIDCNKIIKNVWLKKAKLYISNKYNILFRHKNIS